MTPSYAMATREAKARAMDDGPLDALSSSRPHSGNGASLQQPSQALFSDLEGQEHKLLQQQLQLPLLLLAHVRAPDLLRQQTRWVLFFLRCGAFTEGALCEQMLCEEAVCVG